VQQERKSDSQPDEAGVDDEHDDGQGQHLRESDPAPTVSRGQPNGNLDGPPRVRSPNELGPSSYNDRASSNVWITPANAAPGVDEIRKVRRRLAIDADERDRENAVRDIGARLLVVQGVDDPRVPVGESRQLVDRVRDNGLDVAYMEASNEGHGFRQPWNALYAGLAQRQMIQECLLP